MKKKFLLSDDAILKKLGNRIALIRINKNLTQTETSSQAGISKRTLERLESGNSIQLSGFIRIFRALGLLDEFQTIFQDPVASPMAQLKLQKLPKAIRQRAVKKKEKPIAKKWTWRDL